MPILRVLPWGLCGALVLFSVATYVTLPEMIPQHFDAAGNITAMTERSWGSWAAIPIIAVVTLVFLAGLSAAITRKPQLFNFPEKERFLRIPEAHRGPVIDRMREMLDVAASVTVLVFSLVQFMIWRTALGNPAGGLSIGLVVLPLVAAPGLLVMLSRINGAVDEAEQRWQASERSGKHHAS